MSSLLGSAQGSPLLMCEGRQRLPDELGVLSRKVGCQGAKSLAAMSEGQSWNTMNTDVNS